MKIIKINKKILLVGIIIIVFIITISKVTITLAMQNYYNVDFSTGLVTASSLNVRSGPRNKLSNYNKSL